MKNKLTLIALTIALCLLSLPAVTFAGAPVARSRNPVDRSPIEVPTGPEQMRQKIGLVWSFTTSLRLNRFVAWYWEWFNQSYGRNMERSRPLMHTTRRSFDSSKSARSGDRRLQVLRRLSR